MAKLKGKNSERLSLEQKDKMQVTLDKMTERRETDSIALREILAKKLVDLNNELIKGQTLIKDHLKRIDDLKIQVHRIEGAIALINELIVDKSE